MKVRKLFHTSLFLTILAIIFMTASNTQAKDANKTAYKPGIYAEIQTNQGLIVVQLEYEKCPITVINFIGLAEGILRNTAKPAGQPFYDGLIFHRVIPDFMIQGGCPLGKGTGDPGYKFPDEFDPSLVHSGPGILSMANSGPGTNGSQFFITLSDTSWLNNRHTVFGHVVSGKNVVMAIGGVSRNSQDKPNKPQIMEKVTIVRVGEKAQAFEVSQEKWDELVPSPEAIIAKKWPEAVTTESGLKYVVTGEGEGLSPPPRGTEIKAHYEGSLLDGKVFDSSYKRGKPFSFPVGGGRVIRGWDEAFLSMKKGEKRVLIIPPHLGYGARGAGGVIPPNAWLIFKVELVDFPGSDTTAE